MERILIIGSGGQIGTELLDFLRNRYGSENVVASDVKPLKVAAPFETLDVMDADRLKAIVDQYQITQVYLLAALLSATAEKHPKFAWDLSMQGLFNVLDLAKEGKINKVFWPSSIAVFGPTTPKQSTPQHTIMDPNTVYGTAKLAGERWCEYYHAKYGVDVRSIRYPGIISWKSLPGGGTTDYAVDIFYEAIKNQKYTCFLGNDRELPMMYMDDAIRATVELMDAPADQLTVRSSYNLAGVSFTPERLTEVIQSKIAGFTIDYETDFRDDIAKSWPSSIDDSQASKDWNWESKYGLDEIVDSMLENLSKKLKPL